MSISGALNFPSTITPDGRTAPLAASSPVGGVPAGGDRRFDDRDDPASANAEAPNLGIISRAPVPLVDPSNLSQAQEAGNQAPDDANASDDGEDVFAGGTVQPPPRGFADPARLAEAGASETSEEEEVRIGLQPDEEESDDFNARLVPVDGVDDTGSVALDGRPESVSAGELVSEDQRLTGDPLEVPNFSIDPAERDIQVFNERLTRTNEVLQFLNRRPSSGGSDGISIVV